VWLGTEATQPPPGAPRYLHRPGSCEAGGCLAPGAQRFVQSRITELCVQEPSEGVIFKGS